MVNDATFCKFTGDLWGPLLVCLLLSTLLSVTAPGDSASMVFAAVFVIVWFGAAAVTINAQLLGGTISFFQSVCILGYCVFPLTLSALGCLIMSFIYKNVGLAYHLFALYIHSSTNFDVRRFLSPFFVLSTYTLQIIIKSIFVGVGFIWSTRGKQYI